MLDFLTKNITLYSAPSADGGSTIAIVLPVYAIILIVIAIVAVVTTATIVGIKLTKKKEKNARQTVVQSVTLNSNYSDNIQNAPTDTTTDKNKKIKKLTTPQQATSPQSAQSRANDDDYGTDLLNELGFDEDYIQKPSVQLQDNKASSNEQTMSKVNDIHPDLGDFVISKKVITAPSQGKKRRFSSYDAPKETIDETIASEKAETVSIIENTLITPEIIVKPEVAILAEKKSADDIELEEFYAKKPTNEDGELKDFYAKPKSEKEAIAIEPTAIADNDLDDLIIVSKKKPIDISPIKQNTANINTETKAKPIAMPKQNENTLDESIISKIKPTNDDSIIIKSGLIGKYVGGETNTKQTITNRDKSNNADTEMLDFSTFGETEDVLAETVKTVAPVKVKAATKTAVAKPLEPKKPTAPKKPPAPKKPTEPKTTKAKVSTPKSASETKTDKVLKVVPIAKKEKASPIKE